jgi:hypothetical protein
MKYFLRIALAATVLAFVVPVLMAAPTNPWPMPIPQGGLSAPTNPWPMPIPQGGLTAPTNPWPMPIPQGGLTAL